MSEAKYPSKERVERDGVLVYAEGDDIPSSDIDELKRQGYDPADIAGARTVRATQRIEQDGVLLYAEGDEIPAEAAERLGIKADAPAADKAERPAADKARKAKS